MASNIYNAFYILKKVLGWPKKIIFFDEKKWCIPSYFNRGLKSVEILAKDWKTTELCHKNLSKWEQSQFGPNFKDFEAQFQSFFNFKYFNGFESPVKIRRKWGIYRSFAHGLLTFTLTFCGHLNVHSLYLNYLSISLNTISWANAFQENSCIPVTFPLGLAPRMARFTFAFLPSMMGLGSLQARSAQSFVLIIT